MRRSYLSRIELIELLRQTKHGEKAKELKHQLASLRADYAETLYNMSEPIIRSKTNETTTD